MEMYKSIVDERQQQNETVDSQTPAYSKPSPIPQRNRPRPFLQIHNPRLPRRLTRP